MKKHECEIKPQPDGTYIVQLGNTVVEKGIKHIDLATALKQRIDSALAAN